MGIRKTLGSNRKQLVAQFLLETSLITVVAACLALLLVIALLPVFNNWVQVTLSLQPDWLMAIGSCWPVAHWYHFAGGWVSRCCVVRLLRLYWPCAERWSATRPVVAFAVSKVLMVVQFVVCQPLIVGALVVA